MQDLPAVYDGYPIHDAEAQRARPRPSRLGRSYHLLLRLLGVHHRRQRMDFFFLPRHPLRVLEVGSGSGDRLRALKAVGHDVTGQDMMPGSARAAASRGVEVKVGDLATLRLQPSSFDAVVLHHVLEHVPDPVGLLRTCHGLARPGGTVVSIHPNGASRLHRRFGRDWVGLDAPRHLQVFTPASSRAVGRAAGFAKVQAHTTVLRRDVWTRMSLAWSARNAGRTELSADELNRRSAVAQVAALAAHPFLPGQGDEIVLRLRRSA